MLLAALLWLWPHAAAAQVYHCIGAHGEPVYAGQPCGPPAAPPNAAGGPGAGFSAHCAASPDALRQAIGQAFAAHDVNRLAGFVVWRGLDQAAARAELQRLAVWLRQPVTGVQVTSAGGAPPPGAAPRQRPASRSRWGWR